MTNIDDGSSRKLRGTTARFVMWAVAAIVTVGAATGAVVAASSGRGSNVLSQDDVASALAADSARESGNPGSDDTPGPDDDATGPAVTPSPGGATVPGDNGVFRAAKGGTVVVACDGDLARLVSWSPAQGYRADNAVRGPAARASIQFESDTADDVTLVVTCVAGTPTVQQIVEFDDHGGGGSGGSGGGSGHG